MTELPVMKSAKILLLLQLTLVIQTQGSNLRAREHLPESDPHLVSRPRYRSTASLLGINDRGSNPSSVARVEIATPYTGVPESTGTLDIECGADSVVEECGLRGPDVGMFVCRNDHGSTYTTCVLPNKGQQGDKCGCCSGYCPRQCKCPCPMKTRNMEPTQGVWIQRVGDSSRKICVEPLDSMTRQLGNMYECGIC